MGTPISRLSPSDITDAVIALALVLATQIEIWAPGIAADSAQTGGNRAILSATAALATVPLVARRLAPLLACALVMLGAALQGLLTTPTESIATLIALGLAMYSVAAHAGRVEAIMGGLLALGPLAVTSADLGDGLFGALVLAAPWAAGRAQRARASHIVRLGASNRALSAASHETARRAAADERARIARELHDVVAHRVSTIVVQAQAGAALLTADPPAAAASLRAIDEAGRQALGELRDLLGLLREGGEPATLDPQPDLAGIDGLVEDARASGMAVAVRTEGGARAVPTGVGIAAYRIVQEGLTNVRRHGAGARAEVTLRFMPATLEVEIADDGPGASDRDAVGYGLTGMRERVTFLGGSLTAGPGAAGGFLVRARLPLP